jgi:nanoRNase/pAp phosphatase (c-di-AMP/oligoRNAs hydrolase)
MPSADFMRNCVICGESFHPPRYESVTCGSGSCRSKLARLRANERERQRAHLFAAKEQDILNWFNANIPQAESNLLALDAIYGREAFKLAIAAVREFAAYQKRLQNQKKS